MSTNWADRALSRRQLIKATGLGMAGMAAAPLLSACGSSSGGGSSAGSSSKTIAYSSYLTGTFFTAVLESIKRRAESHGYEFHSTEANGDLNLQFQQVNSMLLKRPRFLLIDPGDSENLIPATKTAKRDKVPVGVVDSPLTGGDVNVTVVFDNELSGKLAGQKVVELVTKKNGAPKGIVLEAYGSLTSLALRQRKSGFESVLKRYPGIKLISRPQNNSKQQALSVIATTLRQYPQLDAVHMPSDFFLQSVRRALSQAGRWKPKDDPKHMIFVSIDGDPLGLEFLQQGYMDADVSQDPVAYGQIAFDMLERHAVQGKAVPLGPYVNKDYFWEKATVEQSPSGPLLKIPAYFVTKENASDPRQWGNVFTKTWGFKAE